MYLLYSALLLIVLVLGSPYWVYEMLRHGKYRRGLLQRLGFVPPHFRDAGRKSIWVHAVSVGEVLAVSELVQRLRASFPDCKVLISTTTDTGQRLAAARFGSENVLYFPLDFAFAMRRWIRALRPKLVVVAETEFWPNLLRIAKQSGAQVAVVNARISDRSLPGYRRWRKPLGRVLDGIDLFLAQSTEDAKRLIEIGAPARRVSVSGNLKYDIPLATPPLIVKELRAAFERSSAGPILVCGSTLEGEESLLLRAFAAVVAKFPRAVMLLAPRHPQRFDEVAELLSKAGIPFSRRSNWDGEPLSGSVVLIDTIGELAGLYGLADLAFVGGSLVPRGGHNIIEPAQYGAAIIVGPHTENFRDIVGLFQSRGAVKVSDAENLSQDILALLANSEERDALGKQAGETLQSQRGAMALTLARLEALLRESKPGVEPA
jgi:3-deoxy-D-manno-octulosonic-acid transferase